MANSYFTNENQLNEWVEAALSIEERFGLDKALGYLIGEKYYNLLQAKYSTKQWIKDIEKQRNKPNYNPIRKSKIIKEELNLDKEYDKAKDKIIVLDEVLIDFSKLIKESFEQYEINKLLNSNPRFGAFGHICSEKEHDYLIEKGAVEHSIETEVEDAMILGELIRLLT